MSTQPGSTTPDTKTLPSYDELPVTDGAPAGSAWGLWGDDDVFGCLNLLTPERVARAAALVRSGDVFALNLDQSLPDPPLYGRRRFEHTVLGQGTSHDDELHMNTQSSSQWDGFRHVGNAHGFWNGVADGDHGIHHWAARGIAGRGVLVDVARWRASVGRPLDPDSPDPIDPDDLDATLKSQGTSIETGDILLIRTGWLGWYRALDAAGRAEIPGNLRAPGLRPGRANAAWLWDSHVAAVAADNPALEAWPLGAHLSSEERRALRTDPSRGMEVFLHLSLLPMLGLPIGELFDLDNLAEACADDGRYEFLLTSAPLHVPGGVASPPNALAIK